MSPVKVNCHNCGALLYESQNGVPAIEAITRRNNQKLGYHFSPISLFIQNKIGKHCKYCGCKLDPVPREVKVIPIMPKTLVEVKRCKKCGKIPPEDSTARQCPYCGGTFEKVYVKKEGDMKTW